MISQELYSKIRNTLLEDENFSYEEMEEFAENSEVKKNER